ncbi:hypothetical protein JGZ69_12180 [Heyndrickxia sporothermodurans]|uniref:Integrase catalytic domain-containing protein n=1 Tax=Heyndrickxia sporothermodurans TaxID=46224 RepID=A0AB37H3R5_9BACI|nr:hypothetical protein JGZ69_12180 [Heyndrickxia sporothermodurans]
MKAETFISLLEKLGIQSSFSRPRVSNDNPYSEAMFRHSNIDQISHTKVLHRLQKQGNGHSNLSIGTTRYTCIVG